MVCKNIKKKKKKNKKKIKKKKKKKKKKKNAMKPIINLNIWCLIHIYILKWIHA